MAPGDYSLLVIHDENRNGKLDKMLGMPREGFGFSRNPAIRMGPPRYGDVRFAVPPGAAGRRSSSDICSSRAYSSIQEAPLLAMIRL